MSRRLHVCVAVPATEEFPRHSEGAIAELADGSLLLVWQEFWKGEVGHLDSDSWPSRLCAMTSRDGGHTWDERRVLAEATGDTTSCYSPSLLRLPDGRLLLAFMRYHTVAPIVSSGFVWTSADEGQSFTPLATAWDHRPLGPTNNVLKRLSSGRLLWPVSAPSGLEDRGQNVWINGAITSDDGGLSWRECDGWAELPLRGAMEPHVEELRDGRVLMIMRTQLGAVFQSWSGDGGATWSKPQTTGLRSPESCPELMRIPQTGDLLLMWNNAPYDPAFTSHYGRRSPLTVAISQDEGATWGHVRDLETDPAWAFSNPAADFTRAGGVLFSYWCSRYHESGRMRDWPIELRVAVTDVDWLYET